MPEQYQSRVIRVVVSAVPGDLAAERTYLQEITFPRLRRRCESRDVTLEVVDLRARIAGENTSQENVLEYTLEELQRSRPFYIGLLGEHYGDVVENIPDGLLRRWPLLAEYHGRSTTDLEIVCGVLTNEAMRGRGFFYFRDPKVIDDAYPARKGARSSKGGQKLKDLKQSISDASQAGVCRLRQNYRQVEELGEWIVDDFTQLLDEFWPVAESRAQAHPYDDDVMFTVYRPGTMAPQKWYSLLAFAHLSARRQDAPADEPDPLAEVQRQAQQLLGEKLAEYRQSSQDSGSSIPHAGEITFKPFIEGFDFNPSSRSFRWEESVHREEFKMRARTAPDGAVAKGWLSVYLGPLILARINLSIKVDSKFPAQTERQDPIKKSARPLPKVFASYSHEDRAIVERIEEMVRQAHLGIEYLRDATKLRIGEEWGPRLMEMIREASAFQLFWSTNSMRSEFVRKEYQYALSLGRKDFVLPVFWEIPFPEKPDEGLPPDELRRLQFEQLGESRVELHLASAGESVEMETQRRASPGSFTQGSAARARQSCKNPVCDCPAPTGGKYCSPACESTGDTVELDCDCGHVKCGSNNGGSTIPPSSALHAGGTDEFYTCWNCGEVSLQSSQHCLVCGSASLPPDRSDARPTASMSKATGSLARPYAEKASPKQAGVTSKSRRTQKASMVLVSAVAILVVGMIGVLPLLLNRSFNSDSNLNANYTPTPNARGRLTGSLVDKNGKPLSGATVSLRNGPETKTDSDGNFLLSDIPAGEQIIEIRPSANQKPDFLRVTIRGNQTALENLVYDTGTPPAGVQLADDPAHPK